MNLNPLVWTTITMTPSGLAAPVLLPSSSLYSSSIGSALPRLTHPHPSVREGAIDMTHAKGWVEQATRLGGKQLACVHHNQSITQPTSE
mmetsp:Transcript_42814/g.85891  ORF Transcript_42814/g.85891 Transcript_42814/m.85891 type:complete len:89 (+) Transcript_42814:261-527(+)